MDAKLKAKWVNALRSGKYKQAFGRLHYCEPDTFCCMGVLGKQLGIGTEQLLSHGRLYILTRDTPVPMRHEMALADMNDSGVPFELIAGFIHENL